MCIWRSDPGEGPPPGKVSTASNVARICEETLTATGIEISVAGPQGTTELAVENVVAPKVAAVADGAMKITDPMKTIWARMSNPSA
jgi:hypothetical protein